MSHLLSVKEAIGRVIHHQDLSRNEMVAVMRAIMTGQCSDAQVAAFLIALRMKGESIEEIIGAVLVMRNMATPVTVNAQYLVDIVGTGGDGAHLFNVSTASSFVAAAAGAHVAKHGNRGVSSTSGSADLLERAGIHLGITPEQIAQCTEQVGVGFMFAPAHHSAMKNVVGVRRELGTRTLFNILGPMSNPAGVDNLVIGVFSKTLCHTVAEVLKRLGNKHVLVVHSEDGLDEISIAAPTLIVELKDGTITEYLVTPEQFGITRRNLSGLNVDNAQDSLNMIKDALGQQESGYAHKAVDLISLNAGAAIYVSGTASNFKKGVDMARDAIASGQALEKMKELVSFTQILSEG